MPRKPRTQSSDQAKQKAVTGSPFALVPSESPRRASTTAKVYGFCVDRSGLARLDNCVKSVLQFQNAGSVVQAELVLSTSEATKTFANIDELTAALTSNKSLVKWFALRYQSQGDAIEVSFQMDGHIVITGYSDRDAAALKLEQIEQEARSLDQEYGPIITWFISSRNVRSVVSSIVAGACFSLLVNIVFYIYAINVGVDIDPSVVPSGNQYFLEVEEALKSSDSSLKLDVLLRGQLKGFANVSTILQRTLSWIVYSAAFAVAGVAGVFLLVYMKKIYPAGFLSLGSNERKLQSFVRQREILIVGIIVAFIVNIAAGLVLAFVFNQ